MLLTALLLLIVSGSVWSFDQQAITVVNLSGTEASDLHAYFSGTFGSVYIDPFGVVSVSCTSPPAVPTNFTVTDSGVIDWGTPCVPPGSSVTFIVSTANGPLILDSICWTQGNVIIGCQRDSVTIDPLPPFGPFGAIKVQVQCRPRPGGFYTLWFPPGTINPRCWARWCCRPTTDYYYRIVWCPFATRLGRLLELPPWFRLTGWRKDGSVGPKYFWIFQTYPPHPDSIIGVGPKPNWPPIGPFGPWPPWAGNIKVRNTDDGQTFRPGADFATSFFDVFYEIQIQSNSVDTFPTFQSQLMVHSPHYAQAAQMLNPLINEVQQVNAAEPHPFLPQIELELLRLQGSMFQMAGQFGAGMTGPPPIYIDARDALNNLAGIFFTQLSGFSPRYANAARDLQAMAEGFDIAVQALMLDPGMVTPLGQDAFRYGLFNRFFLNLPSAATGTMAHVRTQVALGEHDWFPSIQDEIHVIHQSNSTLEIQDMIMGMSDQSSFDLPLVYELSSKAGGPDRMWFKLPAYLGVQVDFTPSDGMTLGTFALIPGDANNDNCVDAADSQMVEDDQGDGGDAASVVPSSDVNADGIVDTTDLRIVITNMGQCGDVFTPIPPPSCCIGVRGDPNNDGAESNILDLTFAVDRIFRGGPAAACFEEGNPNGDAASLNILDLTFFVDRIFRGGPPPVPCPAK